MDNSKTLLTQSGFKKLQDELEHLKVNRRKEIAEKIKEARAQGDLSENAEYDAAKDEILLSDGTKLLMKGSIDRIDVYETNDKMFIRVIDYKSSDRDIDIPDIYYGLEMQLFTYLSEAKKTE